MLFKHFCPGYSFWRRYGSTGIGIGIAVRSMAERLGFSMAKSAESIKQEKLEQLAKSLTDKTDDSSRPNSLASAIAMRDIGNLRLNSKMLAAYVAEMTLGKSWATSPQVESPTRIGAAGRVCKQKDFSQPWFHYWIGQLGLAPTLHRKLWEDAYVIQCLWERGCLEPGKRGLGFAVGAEALPSLITKFGAEVTATDLSHDDERSQGWSLTQQHASDLEGLWKPHLVDRETFFQRCHFEPVDMCLIPGKFEGKYDFCWSVCAFEHLGALDKGLEFVVNAMRTLKPGGIAVHTTEYNVSDGPTIDNWGTVLYQRAHFAKLDEMLRAQNCRLMEIDFDPGSELFDSYVDVPPFPHDSEMGLTTPTAPHIKLSVDGFAATSIAIVAEKL